MPIRGGRRAALLVVIGLSTPALAQDSISAGANAYVVQPGDTLWDISTRFLGEPYFWPRLWSINTQITNPHWIYPGNPIYFQMGTDLEPPAIAFGSAAPILTADPISQPRAVTCGPDLRFMDSWTSDVYSAPGFLSDPEDVEVYGTVARARSPHVSLAENDLLYLDVDDPKAFECGDVVSIFRRVQRKVRHPSDANRRFGDMYRVVGEAVVVHRYGDYLSAEVRDATAEIGRGDLVGPALPLRVEVDVRRPSGDLDGHIVARLNTDAELIATREIVFLDRGRSDGVRQGDSFYVVQQFDESTLERETDLPPAVIGRVVVLRVDEDASTAVITDAARSINVGDQLLQTLE
ncbi:MAG: LysM domain-containing protein [Myxococcota bacterium]